jgi:hypothetical protein
MLLLHKKKNETNHELLTFLSNHSAYRYSAPLASRDQLKYYHYLEFLIVVVSSTIYIIKYDQDYVTFLEKQTVCRELPESSICDCLIKDYKTWIPFAVKNEVGKFVKIQSRFFPADINLRFLDVDVERIQSQLQQWAHVLHE